MALDHLSEDVYRVRTATDTPIEEFRDVDAPHGCFAFVNPTLTAAQFYRQFPLGHASGFAKLREQDRHLAIGNVKLTFGHHRTSSEVKTVASVSDSAYSAVNRSCFDPKSSSKERERNMRFFKTTVVSVAIAACLTANALTPATGSFR